LITGDRDLQKGEKAPVTVMTMMMVWNLVNLYGPHHPQQTTAQSGVSPHVPVALNGSHRALVLSILTGQVHMMEEEEILVGVIGMRGIAMLIGTDI
jgi:hypothetical protein